MTFKTRILAVACVCIAVGVLAQRAAIASDYLRRPVAMLGVDGALHAFQLPTGSLRSWNGSARLEFDDVAFDAWRTESTGVLTTSARSANGTLTVTAAAVKQPDLDVSLPLQRSLAVPDTFVCDGTNPLALVRLEFEPSAGGGAAELVVEVSGDAGLGQAVALRRGRVVRRRTTPRTAAEWRGTGMAGVAVEDSVLVVALAAPDSTVAEINPIGIVDPSIVNLHYALAGRSVLWMVMPFFPVATGDAGALGIGDGDERLRLAAADWFRSVHAGANLRVPEAIVDRTIDASLYHLLGGSFVNCGDEEFIVGSTFLYRDFYIRDGAQMIVALDRYGYHGEARAGIEFVLKSQTPNGAFMSQNGQSDANGQGLWAIGEHLALTRDAEFARAVFPAVCRSVDWYRGMVERSAPIAGLLARDDEFPGLMPETIMQDNEQIDRGHIVGHNLWASAGLRAAVDIARAAGAKDSLAAWATFSSGFDATLNTAIDALLRSTGGVLTPAFEGRAAPAIYPGPYGQQGGLDWGNLGTVYPTRFWRGDDPRLRSNVERWCGELREGLFPYPIKRQQQMLHHYLSTSLAHALLESGRDQDRECLFSIYYDGLLGHTTTTDGGSEQIQSDNRDVWVFDNLPPHSTFAARFLLLTRDMLLRDEGRTLVLGSGLSPAWMVPGQTIECRMAATPFGWATFVAEVGDDPAGVRLDLSLGVTDRLPARLVERFAAAARLETPIRPSLRPRSLEAVRFDAPLGYVITAVTDAAGKRLGVIDTDGRRVTLPKDATVARIVLAGASDPRWSVESAFRRLGE